MRPKPVRNFLGKLSLFLFIVGRKILLYLIAGALVGIAGTVFLLTLQWVTDVREERLWLLSFLPLGGLLIGATYHKWGREIEEGSNLVLRSFSEQQRRIPFRMAPFIYLSTLITHLFGGSAGREGTAVQIGAAIADQFSVFSGIDRKALLILGIASGFSAVFGTPFAGAVFALEINRRNISPGKYILPAFLGAYVSYFVSHYSGATHAQYEIDCVPAAHLAFLLYAVFAGICFGLISRAFVILKSFLALIFQKTVNYPPLRPVAGGIIVALLLYITDGSRFAGLGIPVIQNAFHEVSGQEDFIIKLFLTALTLASGFKGGEVTPLFFIGATSGSFLSFFIPLPTSLLAGMGFLAVFGSAARLPLACLFMGAEIFGPAPLLFFATALFFASSVAGRDGIYHLQDESKRN